MKIKTFNETKEKIPSKLLKGISDIISTDKSLMVPKQSVIHLISQSLEAITKLNKEVFNKNTVTDVISVIKPSSESLQPTALIGDIYICPEVIKSNAKKFNTDFDNELARVIIHGILHLLGHDHNEPFGESKEEMFRIQEELLKQVAI